MHQSIFLSLLALLMAVNLCEAAIENFVLHKRTTVWGRTVFRIRRPSSLEQCAQTCLNNAKCRAFVYSRITRYCYGRKQSYPANRNHWRRSSRYDYYEQNDNRYPAQERIPAWRDFSIIENSRHVASVHRQPTTILRRPYHPSRQIPYHRERPVPTRTTTTERPVTTTSRPAITRRPTTTTRETITTRRPDKPIKTPTAATKTRRPQPPRRPVAPRRPTKTTKKTIPTRRPQPPRRRPPVPPKRLDETTKPPTKTMSTMRTTTMTTTKQTRRPVTTTTTRTTTEQTTRKRPPTVVPELSCDRAVGIGDGTILDDQIKASSSYWTFVPASGRLETGSGWMASTTKDNEYLEIDFGGPKEIVAVATQGGKYFFASEYTQTYKLQFTRNNDDEFEAYRERGQEKIFDGNTDASGIVKNKLLTPVKAYKIRFLPVTFYNNVLLRVEAYEAC